MLTEAIKQNITSLSLSELGDLCEEYLAENGAHTEDEFVTYLYNSNRITAKEYRNIQTHEKVELTSIADISDLGKKKKNDDVVDSSLHISGTYVDDEDYTILESIDEGC